MTVITKPLSEKKEDKLILPLVDNDQLASAPPGDDPEAPTPDFTILRARARRVSHSTTLCLLITALVVVGIGIMGGTYLYRQYLRSQIFKGWCAIPYEKQSLESNAMFLNGNSDYDDSIRHLAADFSKNYQALSDVFNEQFELDMENEAYEKIDVPDFRDGRTGRFVHDFNANTTGIIDITGKRCFIMPLNRDNVLPPSSLRDLLYKMGEGYYDVDTQVVRETMRVVTPPITDTKKIGAYIVQECDGLPIYKLEKYVGGVVKRSADLGKEAKFAQFSGKGILELDIINFDELQTYEEHLGQ